MISALTQPQLSIFAALPSELVYEIFEHAAFAGTETALALSLVSSWAKKLVEPLLYHTVVLSSARGVIAFERTLATKPPSFAQSHVKHLGILAQGPVQAIDSILDTCKKIESLACGFSLPGYKKLHGNGAAQALECPKEQHLLGLSCRDGWDFSLVGPTVTHLRVHITSPQRSIFPLLGANTTLEASHWDLSYLSALTHLAIVYRPPSSQPVDSIMDPLQRLLTPEDASAQTGDNDTKKGRVDPKLSLVLIQVTGSKASQAATVDALNSAAISLGGRALRIVAEHAPSSAVCQWEQAVRGGRGVWEHAEQVVGERLAAEARCKL